MFVCLGSGFGVFYCYLFWVLYLHYGLLTHKEAISLLKGKEVPWKYMQLQNSLIFQCDPKPSTMYVT